MSSFWEVTRRGAARPRRGLRWAGGHEEPGERTRRRRRLDRDPLCGRLARLPGGPIGRDAHGRAGGAWRGRFGRPRVGLRRRVRGCPRPPRSAGDARRCPRGALRDRGGGRAPAGHPDDPHGGRGRGGLCALGPEDLGDAGRRGQSAPRRGEPRGGRPGPQSATGGARPLDPRRRDLEEAPPLPFVPGSRTLGSPSRPWPSHTTSSCRATDTTTP